MTVAQPINVEKSNSVSKVHNVIADSKDYIN